MATTPPPVETDRLLELTCGHVAARALHTIAEAGIADRLGEEPRTTEALAAEAGVDGDALHRLLRVLEQEGIFRFVPANGAWTHTPLSRALRSDHPRSRRAFARMMGMPFGWTPFTELATALRTGRPSVEALDPAGPWAYLESQPEQLTVFQQSMEAKAHGDVQAVLSAYDFSGHRRVVDVGGGRGHLVRAVAASSEGTTGVLVDLAPVVAQVQPSDRVGVVAADFFVDPLPAGDAYVLMNILHDWPDGECVRILRAVTEAGRAERATVLVVETLLPEDGRPHWSKTLDVIMLALTGGRERTVEQYGALLDAAGLDVRAVHATTTAFSVVEGRVRS